MCQTIIYMENSNFYMQYIHNFPQTHFLLMADIVSNGKPLTAEKVASEMARFTRSILGGVRSRLDLLEMIIFF